MTQLSNCCNAEIEQERFRGNLYPFCSKCGNLVWPDEITNPTPQTQSVEKILRRLVFVGYGIHKLEQVPGNSNTHHIEDEEVDKATQALETLITEARIQEVFKLSVQLSEPFDDARNHLEWFDAEVNKRLLDLKGQQS